MKDCIYIEKIVNNLLLLIYISIILDSLMFLCILPIDSRRIQLDSI